MRMCVCVAAEQQWLGEWKCRA